MKEKRSSKTITFSRDEMNLAEFPLAVLSTRVNPNIKTLEFQDTIYTQDKKPITRKWIITGADKFGLPTSSDDEVLMGLLKLTADKEFENPKVVFTRYELLKILNWTTEGRSYQRLQKSLDRLSGVRIKAANAFYDNKTKENCTKNFGIIVAYEINSGRGEQNQPSFFIWSDEMFESFQKGYIKKLDLDFYLSLKSAVSKRLYRYLDKYFYYKSVIELDLFKLAYEKIGISRNFKYASSLKQQINPALEELLQKNFIKKFEFTGKGKNSQIIIYRTSTSQLCLSSGISSTEKSKLTQNLKEENQKEVFNEYDTYSFAQGNSGITGIKNEVIDITELDPLTKLKNEIIEKLKQRQIKETQSLKLLKEKTLKNLNKISKIIEYYDYLVGIKSVLVSKSPVGFLYRAIEKEDTFYLPPKFSIKEDDVEHEVKHVKKSKSENREQLQKVFWEERNSQIDEIRKEIDEKFLLEIEEEARKSLSNMKGMISSINFEKAVTNRVNDKLASLYALSSFDEWLKERKAI